MESRREIIQYRLGRGKMALEEAMLLSHEGYQNSAINRLYYASFYAVSAYLFAIGENSHTHRGVKSALNQSAKSKS